jgi:transposase-like protein
LSAPEYAGFGPTLAAEYLAKKHGIEASKETVRQWMIGGKLWRAGKQKVKQDSRMATAAEPVWRTGAVGHQRARLAGGAREKLYLIAMIDDATSRLFARFVRHDSTEENMKLLWSYVEKFGRPLAFYTDKASLFRTAEKRKRDEPGVDKDRWRCRRRRLGARCRNWGSCGSRRILRRRKDAWKGISGRRRIGW